MPSFRFAGMNTLTLPTAIDVFNGKSKEYGQCVDIVNCDVDDEDNATRREGSTLIVPSVATSGWGNGDKGYCIVAGRLNSFDGAVLTILDANLVVGADCEFAAVNDVVVFSDGTIIGIIDGATVVRIDRPADWVDVTDLAAWVAAHAPADPAKWNGTDTNSNFQIDAYKLATLAGNCLCCYGGALFLAIDNFIYVTKTFDIEHMDIRYCVVAGFAGAVTFIKDVNGGLYVGTTKGCFFLPGGGIVVDEKGTITEAFSQRQANDFPAIKGTAVRVAAEFLPQFQAAGMVVLWATAQGIFAGMEGGTVLNLSRDRVKLPTAASGKALFRDVEGLRQYLVSLGSEVWVLNVASQAHSRYQGYVFTSIMAVGDHLYGTHASGIFKLEGETDAHRAGAKVDAYALTPAPDFGNKNVKWAESLYLLAACSGDITVDYYVNGKLAFAGDTIIFDDLEEAHTRRAHPPKGLKGTTWQLKISNVDGGRFTFTELQPGMVASSRRTT